MNTLETTPRIIAVKHAVSSAATCSSATVNELLSLLKDPQNATCQSDNKVPEKKIPRRPQRPIRPTKAITLRSKEKAEVTVVEIHEECVEVLQTAQRCRLATEIVNATLKSLTEAIKNPKPQKPHRKSLGRRSLTQEPNSSLPLQPRCVNQLMHTPEKKPCCPSIAAENGEQSYGVIALAECARAAFAALRNLDAQKSSITQRSSLQIENGMSALIGKMITLGLDDMAVKELRILVKRLSAREGVANKLSRSKTSNDQTSISSNQTLSDLLLVPSSDSTSGERLSLIVTSQLLVLRLLVSKKRPSSSEAAYAHLRLSTSYSPVNLLLRLAAESSPGAEEKAAKQLEVLSQAILSLCPSPLPADDEIAADFRRSLSPYIAFQYQVLALEIRVKWWKLSGHKADLGGELVASFTRFLKAFSRRSSMIPLEKYHKAKEAYQAFSSTLDQAKNTSSESSAKSPKNDHFDLYHTLTNLAKDASVPGDATYWTRKSIAIGTTHGVSHSRVCEMHCQMAIIQLKEFLDGNLNVEPWKCLITTVEALQGDLQGDSADLDDLLVTIAKLRKVTFLAIFSHSDASQIGDRSGGREGISGCINSIYASFLFLSRYLGTEPDSGSSNRVISRYHQRRILAQKTMKPGLESLVNLAKHAITDDDNTWMKVEKILQLCTALVPKLNYLGEETTPNEITNGHTYFLLLSHAYWCHYLRLKQNSPSSIQLQKCLQNSVNLLDQCSSAEKIIGLLPTKLERLGAMYEADIRSSKPLQLYIKSLKVQIDAGVLLEAATRNASRPLQLALEQDTQMSAFHRSLTNFLRAINETDDIQEYSSCLFDDESLPREERGLIFEQQLLILESMLQNCLPIKNPQRAISKISITLLELYVKQEYPLRRLRTVVCLLRLHSNHPSAITEDSMLQILEESSVILSDISGGDIGLERFQPHLLATRDAYVAMTATLSDTSILQATVGVWAHILRQCKAIEDLKEQIYDIPAWLNQLTSIANFLDMQGYEGLRVEVLNLTVTARELGIPKNPAIMMSSLSLLGRQLLRLGNLEKAGSSFERAKEYMTKNIPAHVLIEWHLSSTEYFLEIGNMAKCREHLSSANALHSAAAAAAIEISISRSLTERLRVIWTKARLLQVQSHLSSTQGHFAQAMLNARDSVKLTYCAWAILERQNNKEPESNEVETLSDAVSLLSITGKKTPPVVSTRHESLKSTPFWSLASELFRRLCHLSQLYVHGGSISEAQYYVEQASKIAVAVNSKGFRAQLLTLTGQYDLCRGEVENGLRQLEQVKALIIGNPLTHLNIIVEALSAEVYGSRAQWYVEELALKRAEEDLRGLESMEYGSPLTKTESSDCNLASQPRELSIKEVVSNQIQASKKGGPVAKRPVKQTTGRAVPVIVTKPKETIKNLSFLKYRGHLLRQRATSALHQNKTELAASYLTQATQYMNTTQDSVSQSILQARLYLHQCADTISSDPVFCILHESTVSFPSIALSSRRKSKEALEPIRENERRALQSKKTPIKQVSKSPSPEEGIQRNEIDECLSQALDTLMKVHSSAQVVASSTVIHTLSDIFGKVMMMIHATCFNSVKSNVNPFTAVHAMELGRSLCTQKESLMIQVERTQCLKQGSDTESSISSLEDSSSTLMCSAPLLKSFQSDYIDIIPSTWSVLSLSISENLNELQFSKLRAGQTPFILSIPLNRHNSRDADEDIFAFSQGKSELADIIDLANYSTHDPVDLSRKGAKSEWWEARSALDSRLNDLLENIENIWLGGFRGIFSQDQPSNHLLARFQKSFYNILDKYLPSRQRSSKATKASRVILDQRVLELFVGLGNPGEIRDLDEPLMDLLYFVVDILQFHGERNAYDEIDFDSITVETLDALRHYHETVAKDLPDKTSSHTILILDKALHCFPWESLPCMAGKAISRLPSLVCLRDRILQMQQQQHTHTSGSSSESLHIDSQNTSYILNPSADLSSTQSTFSPVLSSLSTIPCATPNIIARDPTEAEFSSIISSRSLFLYFGHGSGGQYIRSRTIKKMDQCAVALLMGCSSGKLKEEGKYEPHGMVYNYLHAGSPAVVGTLWDVTDKDIDRWGMECLSRWGLFEDSAPAGGGVDRKGDVDDAFSRRANDKGTGGSKSKSKTRAKSRVREGAPVADNDDDEDEEVERDSSKARRGENRSKGKVTLDQAVAWGREKCFLRYLNGAAPVVYGIPVSLF